MRSDSKGSLAPYSGAHKAPSPGRPGLSPARLWLLRGLFVPCVDSRPPPLPPVGSASTAGSGLLPCCGEGWGEERPPSDLLIIKAIRIILSGPAVGLFLPAAGVSSSFWSHKTWKKHFKRFPGTPPPPQPPFGCSRIFSTCMATAGEGGGSRDTCRSSLSFFPRLLKAAGLGRRLAGSVALVLPAKLCPRRWLWS